MPSYAAIFNLAILELAADNPDKAREAAIIAVDSAKTGEEKSNAYILLGDAEVAAGASREARKAYNAALDSYPESRLARSRLQRLDAP
jgi:predicted negative regulator of RcsB-dependent stress response